MADVDIVALFMYCAAGIVIASWLAYIISDFVLCWKHDRYLNKNFPELINTDAVYFFTGSCGHLKVLSNALSPGYAPDEYLSLLRRKIRRAVFGIWLSISLLPILLFLLLVVLVWAFENGPPNQ